MANWKIKIKVSNIWQEFEDSEDFESFKAKLVPALKSYQSKIEKNLGTDEAMYYDNLVQEIEYAADDVDEFDEIFADMYDWADGNKVWIETF